MNSAPVSDSSTAAAPQLMAFPGVPAPSEEGTETFGNLLAQVTAHTVESTQTEETDPLALPSTASEPEEEEKKSDPILTAAPLVFFCPPPEIKPLPGPETAPGGALTEEGEPELAVCNTPVSPEQKADSKEVIETVRPKNEKVVANAKEAKLPAPDQSGKLLLKGFEKVAPAELEVVDSKLPKLPDITSNAPPPPPRGTVVAQQANAVKNSQKSAEIAPTIEQKMPVGERSRRALPEQARFETAGFIADTFSKAKGEFSVEAPAREISVRSAEGAELVQTIQTEVAHLRQRGDANLTVAIKPDNGTELKLEVSVARDGTIHANVRFERGDFQTLNAQWPQLQQSLAAQGIRVNDLAYPGQSQNQNQPQNHDSSHAQNFDRGNNPQHRQQQPHADFEEELAASTPRYQTNKNFKTTAAPSRRWQSWA